jgi:hypothetical protein
MKKRKIRKKPGNRSPNKSTRKNQETPITKRKSALSKYFFFYYPEESSIKLNLLILVNSAGLLMPALFLISRYLLDFPDLKNIPKLILWIAGTGLFSAVGITLGVFLQMFSRQYFLDRYYRKVLFMFFTIGRIVSISSIVLILIYSIRITDLFTFLLYKLEFLSENIVNFITGSLSIIISILTGIISNGISILLKLNGMLVKNTEKITDD